MNDHEFDHGQIYADHGQPWSLQTDHGQPWSLQTDHGQPWSLHTDHGQPYHGQLYLTMVGHGQEHGQSFLTMVNRGRFFLTMVSVLLTMVGHAD